MKVVLPILTVPVTDLNMRVRATLLLARARQAVHVLMVTIYHPVVGVPERRLLNNVKAETDVAVVTKPNVVQVPMPQAVNQAVQNVRRTHSQRLEPRLVQRVLTGPAMEPDTIQQRDQALVLSVPRVNTGTGVLVPTVEITNIQRRALIAVRTVNRVRSQ